MDIVKEMREAYYRALHGQMVVNATAFPMWQGSVPKDQNPDLYGLISVSGNTSLDTMDSQNSIYVTQFTIVCMNSTFADNATVDSLGDQFWQIVEPRKGVTGINPIGFQILTTDKQTDITRDPYLNSANKIVVERIIQVKNTIFHI